MNSKLSLQLNYSSRKKNRSGDRLRSGRNRGRLSAASLSGWLVLCLTPQAFPAVARLSPDAVISSMGPSLILMNDGHGKYFDSGLRLGEELGSQECRIRDLDNDGDRDVFITTYRRPGAGIWLNQLSDKRD